MRCCDFSVFTSFTLFLAAVTQVDLLMVYVTPVKNPTYAEEYQCVAEANVDNSYHWYRQDLKHLPQNVKVEGDRLHLLKSTIDLNGLYICKVVNQHGEAVGSIYRHINTHEEL